MKEYDQAVQKALKPWPLWVKFCLLFIKKQSKNEDGVMTVYKTFRGHLYIYGESYIKFRKETF